MSNNLTLRAEAVDRRTYRRPLLGPDGSVHGYESREDAVKRATRTHVTRLLELNNLNPLDYASLLDGWEEAVLTGKASPAGRTRWLGGTDVAFDKPECQFNCSFLVVKTPADMAELFWLELCGTGTGAEPIAGSIHKLPGNPQITCCLADNPSDFRGNPTTQWVTEGGALRVTIGDSAEGWVHALQFLLSVNAIYSELILDFTQIRGAGGRLKGFGWLCNGPQAFAKALSNILDIRKSTTGEHLTAIEVGRIINWLGTVLSTRRSAQNLLMDAGNPEVGEFEVLKSQLFHAGNDELRQSNNSVMHYDSPGVAYIAQTIRNCLGGVDLGLLNLKAAQARAYWFVGTNPCFEILLADCGFCNLVDVNLAAIDDSADLMKTIALAAKVNYLQACVDFDKSGMLSDRWTKNNTDLRLCGVGLTGIVQASWLTDAHIAQLRDLARDAANQMAKEVGLEFPAAITTVKPSGTLSKVMAREEWGEVAEGIHCPLGQYIFNWINFSKHDPLVNVYKEANLEVIDHPTDPEGVLIKFPAEYRNIDTFVEKDGLMVNAESALTQYERVARFNKLWCDHNASCTLYVEEAEVDELAQRIHDDWDKNLFTSLSFGWKADPTATPEDYNQKYLPQQVVSEEEFTAYTSRLETPDFSGIEEAIEFEIDMEECEGGHCPVR